MESIVRSFVGKIRQRSAECGGRNVVLHLLPVLRSDTPPDLVEEALSILVDFPELVVEVGGLEKIAELESLTPTAANAVVTIVHACPRTTLDPVLQNEALLHRLVEWHRHSEPVLLLGLLEQVSRYDSVAPTATLVPKLVAIFFNSTVFDDPFASVRLLELLPRLVYTEEAAQHLWSRGGAFLLDAVCRHRVQGRATRAGVLVRSLAELVLHQPILTDDALHKAPLVSLAEAVCMDARDFDDFVTLDTALHSAALRERLQGHAVFLETYVHSFTMSMPTLTPSLVEGAMEHLADMVPTKGPIHGILELFDAARGSVHGDALAQLAWILCATTRARDVVLQFPSLCEVHAQLAQEEHVCEHFRRFDAELSSHFEALAAHPACIALPLVVRGCSVPTLAKHLLPFLHSPIARPTEGTLLHAAIEDVDAGTTQLTTATACPITLERMRCPVVATDGHTYELAALVRLFRTGETRSPLTRETLSPSVVYNRALLASLPRRRHIRVVKVESGRREEHA